MTTLLLDSANTADVTRAVAAGVVAGITTNPTLLRRETDDPLRHVAALLQAADLREIYYQPTGAYGPLLEEAEKAWALDPERMVLKVPATPDGVSLAAALVRRGVAVALTAAQTPQCMIVADSIGCASVIPYVDRALRDLRTESDLVRSLHRLRRGRTRIVAASVKNVGQLVQAFHDGADAVTAPSDVLELLMRHPASIDAERTFLAEYADD